MNFEDYPFDYDFIFFDRTFCGNPKQCPLSKNCERCLTSSEQKHAPPRLSFSSFYSSDQTRFNKCKYFIPRIRKKDE